MKPYRVTYEPERRGSRPWVLRKRHGARFLTHAWRRFSSLAQALEAIRDHELEVELRRGLGRQA